MTHENMMFLHKFTVSSHPTLAYVSYLSQTYTARKLRRAKVIPQSETKQLYGLGKASFAILQPVPKMYTEDLHFKVLNT